MVCSINNAYEFNDSSAGLECRFVNNSVWTTKFSDTYFWNQPGYYSAIHLADISGAGNADVCGRGTAGVYCGLSQGMWQRDVNGDGRTTSAASVRNTG
jgi:hypothetical protein